MAFDLSKIKLFTDQLDPATIKSFLVAAKNVADQLVVQVKQAKSTSTPGPTNYLDPNGGLDRSAPEGGWLTPETLQNYSQRMTEALTAEKWEEGFVACLALLSAVGAI